MNVVQTVRVSGVLVCALLMFGCASVSQQRSSIALEGGGKINLTEVDWGVGIHGGPVIKHYVAETLRKNGEQATGVFDKGSSIGTLQQVFGNLATSGPGAIAYGVVGLDFNGALRQDSKRNAQTSREVARIAQETSRHAVDNQQPSYIDNSEYADNSLFLLEVAGGQGGAGGEGYGFGGQSYSSAKGGYSVAQAGAATNTEVAVKTGSSGHY